MTQGLTQQQDQMLSYLRTCEHTPSYREMKEALGISSTSRIKLLVDGLKERGFIETMPNRARALRVLEVPRTWDEQLFDYSTATLVSELRRRGALPKGIAA